MNNKRLYHQGHNHSYDRGYNPNYNSNYNPSYGIIYLVIDASSTVDSTTLNRIKSIDTILVKRTFSFYCQSFLQWPHEFLYWDFRTNQYLLNRTRIQIYFSFCTPDEQDLLRNWNYDNLMIHTQLPVVANNNLSFINKPKQIYGYVISSITQLINNKKLFNPIIQYCLSNNLKISSLTKSKKQEKIQIMTLFFNEIKKHFSLNNEVIILNTDCILDEQCTIYEFPKGKKKSQELPIETALREFKEETKLFELIDNKSINGPPNAINDPSKVINELSKLQFTIDNNFWIHTKQFFPSTIQINPKQPNYSIDIEFYITGIVLKTPEHVEMFNNLICNKYNDANSSPEVSEIYRYRLISNPNLADNEINHCNNEINNGNNEINNCNNQIIQEMDNNYYHCLKTIKLINKDFKHNKHIDLRTWLITTLQNNYHPLNKIIKNKIENNQDQVNPNQQSMGYWYYWRY